MSNADDPAAANPDAPSVLLDGLYVSPYKIDAAKHRFIGLFRPPINPFAGATAHILCPCGDILKWVHQGNEHYRKGCLDVPQYVSISPAPEAGR